MVDTQGPSEPRWRIALDTGGTFTDAIAIDPAGRWHRRKVPSDGSIPCVSQALGRELALVRAPWWLPAPESTLLGGLAQWPDGTVRRLQSASAEGWQVDGEIPPGTHVIRVRIPARNASPTADAWLDAPVLAISALVGIAPTAAFPPIELRLSTTRGTNALLERRGARTGLLITHGFEDLLEIGDQSRPDLFAVAIRKREPLCELVLGLEERLLADGSRRRPFNKTSLETLLPKLRSEGIESVAVASIHALAHPEHEAEIVDAIRTHLKIDVVGAASLSDSGRFLSRVETAVVHAALAPVIRRYLENVAPSIEQTSTFMMTSAGGLQRADRYLARDSLLSGPAGGAAGVAEIAGRINRSTLLGFDMGGTSTDVTRFDGGLRYRFETRVGGARVAAPAIAIESVAAGGGSICRVRRGELQVGPESAGANPGPACYGRGGPLTLTDVNLLLGRMDPDHGSIPLDSAASRRALDAVRAELATERGEEITPGALLEAFIDIADERMAGTIANVTVREGADPRDYALVAFGGAGGQHACALAQRLGIAEVVFPTDAGILSARGVLGARIERFASEAILQPLTACTAELMSIAERLGDEAMQAVRRDIPTPTQGIAIGTRLVSVRLDGQDQALDLPFRGPESIPLAFAAAFRNLFGYAPPSRPLVVEALRVSAIAPSDLEASASPLTRVTERPVSVATRQGTLDRSTLQPGDTLIGPSLLLDDGATAYLPRGWQAKVNDHGDVLATRIGSDATTSAPRTGGDIAELDLFACRLEATATSMGELLRRTAFSTNVKERLDYSCAVLDAQGMLLQNAPHLPVHLGAMGVCVRGVAAALELGPGDVAITNHPAYGGSHLPDVTLITPVFIDGMRVGYVANRAHHAEIGGSRPGSFPPNAKTLAEEGVVIEPMRLVEAGVPRFERIEALLRAGPWPSRAVEENIADLRASLAANSFGAAELTRLVRLTGAKRFAELGEELLRRSQRALEGALRRRGNGRFHALERLDDGSPIEVRITLDDGRATIDFTGSAGVHPRNLNAPLAVVRAATLYVLRLLVGEEIPMNEGLLRPVQLIVPTGMLNPPFDGAAGRDPHRAPPVVTGNTETSQRVTDALLRAFGLCAGSQGTMNNLLFGNASYGAYETICGGSGATADAPGASAVHTHMTNTRITDPEVLERRCPVIVRSFAVRHGSGGQGRHRGGDGVAREIEFREATQVSILAQHRIEQPYGLADGSPGAVGRQWHITADGTRHALPGIAAIDCEPGDAIRIETPGGGGYGATTDAASHR
ncbi:MAG: hydantoinase B/oxoprolinase family protein [Phycisphaerae bacterium]|nr:hydantoinase B/oxoprolinase family protein [Phycisphaerae bacterium]